jgi:hypothetical protein
VSDAGPVDPDVSLAVLGLVVVAGLALALAVLTAVGARRRGAPVALAVAEGAVFPLTWIAWYAVDGPGPVEDEH